MWFCGFFASLHEVWLEGRARLGCCWLTRARPPVESGAPYKIQTQGEDIEAPPHAGE